MTDHTLTDDEIWLRVTPTRLTPATCHQCGTNLHTPAITVVDDQHGTRPICHPCATATGSLGAAFANLAVALDLVHRAITSAPAQHRDGLLGLATTAANVWLPILTSTEYPKPDPDRHLADVRPINSAPRRARRR